MTAHTDESADAACCRASRAAVPPFMSRAHFGSFGLYHMFPHAVMTSRECGTTLAFRVSRMASFIWFFTSVPMKWCSLAYMCDTAVSGSSFANARHAGSVVRKFSPTFKHQMRFSLSTSVSFSSCSS